MEVVELKAGVSKALQWAKSKTSAVVATAAAAVASAPAFAQETGAVDVSDVVSKITAQASPIALIGSAILVVVVGIAAYKWVRRAISG